MDYKYSDITEKIIGAAMKVHRYLGNGFQEVVYQRCLAIELTAIGLTFEREVEQKIYYGMTCVGTRRVDFLVDDKILVEIKALIRMENVHLAQAINYIEAFNLDIGLLINFGAISLEFRRLHNKRKKS